MALPLLAQDPPAIEGALPAESEAHVTSSQNCSFIAAPDEVTNRETRARRDAYDRALRFSKSVSSARGATALVDAVEIPRRNFIDDEIFGRLQTLGVRSAPLATDEEFLRRVTLDLAGRIPSMQEYREFTSDSSTDKRDRVIDRLLFSPEFVDKWVMWYGDLLQNARFAQNRSQQTEGRNRVHEYLQNAVANGKSLRDIAFEMVAINGNNYDRQTPGANFILRGFHPMGPVQDTYDLIMVKTATTFLGMGHYDCISCHDGRGHLTTISLWGAKAKRVEAQRMAAFFSRVNMTRHPSRETTDYYYDSYYITDSNGRGYTLNTTSGNRPRREPLVENGQTSTTLTPVYRTGRGAEGNWREAFVRNMIEDPMFSTNFANRLWKAMFGMGIAEPVDFLDPERLAADPSLPEGWTSQASHPALLQKLSQWMRDGDYNLREYLRLIASSSAYQLSSRYDGDWKYEYTNLFARHLPRRLEGEEVHDAILRATGTTVSYLPAGYAEPIRWAMQLPEPTEPRGNGVANAFMNSFQRGNRDTLQRSQSGSILMYLNLMNSGLVNDRVLTRNSPNVRAWSQQPSDENIVDEMFLTFLSRKPTEAERNVALKPLNKTTGAARSAAVEDLAWALTNKVDFLFSY